MIRPQKTYGSGEDHPFLGYLVKIGLKMELRVIEAGQAVERGCDRVKGELRDVSELYRILHGRVGQNNMVNNMLAAILQEELFEGEANETEGNFNCIGDALIGEPVIIGFSEKPIIHNVAFVSAFIKESNCYICEHICLPKKRCMMYTQYPTPLRDFGVELFTDGDCFWTGKFTDISMASTLEGEERRWLGMHGLRAKANDTFPVYCEVGKYPAKVKRFSTI